MSANDKQVGGNHYKHDAGEEHWDRIWRMYGRGYFIGCATKYLERYQDKNGKQDLDKAIHFIEKLRELEYGPESVIVSGPTVKVGNNLDGFNPMNKAPTPQEVRESVLEAQYEKRLNENFLVSSGRYHCRHCLAVFSNAAEANKHLSHQHGK